MDEKLISPHRSAIACVAQKLPPARAEIVVVSKRSVSPLWQINGPPLSIINAAVASLRWSNSINAPSMRLMSSSMSWGRPMFVSNAPSGALVDEFVQQQPRDHVQRLEHPLALRGH